MAQKSIQIADKPTLDAAKALLEDSGVGLAAIKEAVSSGVTSGSAGGLQIENITNDTASGNVSATNLPYEFYNGSAVVLNGEIHILGSSSSSYYKYHYKFNGSSWESVSTLPYDFCYGSAVVLNGEIHILGSSDYRTNHYKYNGTSWESVSTLPYSFYNGSAVVLNNEIHILGGTTSSYMTSHYKFNGTDWEEVTVLPIEFYNGSAVVLNDEIHILGSSHELNYYKIHYKFNGTTWISVFSLPYSFYNGSAVVLNNEIRILGSKYVNSSNNYPYTRYHYTLGNDYRTIATLLPKGAHILLPDNVNIKYVSDNAVTTPNNIVEVTETGIVEVIAEFISPNDTKKFLTFY